MNTTFSKVAYKAIVTRHLPATMRLPGRVKASDSDGNATTISWDSSLNTLPNHQRAAAALCEKMGWRGHYVSGAAKDGYVHVLDRREGQNERA